jgi:hypothetical protein
LKVLAHSANFQNNRKIAVFSTIFSDKLYLTQSAWKKNNEFFYEPKRYFLTKNFVDLK